MMMRNDGVVIFPEQRVVYMRRVGAYGAENGCLMQKLKAWALEHRKLGQDAVILGIALDDPAVQEPSRCRYDVCLVVPEHDRTEGKDVQTRSVDGGKYFVFQIEHTPEAVANAWNKCIPVLITQGYQLDRTRPILERYEKRKVDQHICELCFPVS